MNHLDDGNDPRPRPDRRLSAGAVVAERSDKKLLPHGLVVCKQRYSRPGVPEVLVGGGEEVNFVGEPSCPYPVGGAASPLDESLYLLLAQAGLTIHHAFATLRPVIADARLSRLSRLLEVRRGSPLQYVEQVDFTASGAPAMLSSEWHVPGIFELSVYRRPLAGGGE